MISGANNLYNHKKTVDELNVFPVPDGDTGTNMSMTLSAASTELRKADGITLTKAADKTASALLRGARGNSGVILSLLFRGFSKSLKGKTEAEAASIPADGSDPDLAALCTISIDALQKAAGDAFENASL